MNREICFREREDEDLSDTIVYRWDTTTTLFQQFFPCTKNDSENTCDTIERESQNEDHFIFPYQSGEFRWTT